MKNYNTLYDSYLRTGLDSYRGRINTAISALNYNDINSVCLQLKDLSMKLNNFLSTTGLYVPMKSLVDMHKQLDNYIKILSNSPVISYDAKRRVEDYLYNLLSAFGSIKDFCSSMYYIGL